MNQSNQMPNMSKDSLFSEIASYYSQKLEQHGATPKGVDWNGVIGQTTRFNQIYKLFEGSKTSFSLNDIGCGYGALLDYLQQRNSAVNYLGLDISKEMVVSAMKRHKLSTGARFIVASTPDQIADYSVASGIFNVRMKRADDEWNAYLLDMLEVFESTSKFGFAFNCLSSYSDEDKKKSYLYYANPCQLFDLCKRRYSRHVTLLHDYNLYEFTILVRKEL
jgi:SAM-dependent methyltransferase